ncbi:MAG TPA: SGNH/GDSL hydrolase family protein, partial [Caulobacteraceae bacterium]
MTYASAQPMLAAYRRGDAQAALAAAAQVLAADPYAADAHLICGLIHLRSGAVAETVSSLKACLKSRSAEWVLERLRRDLIVRGGRPLGRDMVLKVGALLRSNLSPLGAPLPPERRRANHAYVNVVGSSWVRSFGASTGIFPLFIGMGPLMLLLDEQLAAVTQRKFAENLKRVDASRNTLLISGSDPYYYVTDARKADSAWPTEVTPQDLAMMDTVAERHRPILRDAKARLTGTTILLGLTPTFDDKMNALCQHLNVRLKALCEEMDVRFIDCWEELADPATGRLREDAAAQAYPGDIHFSAECLPIFITLLQREGLLSSLVAAACDFDWTHVFEAQVDSSERTRIWSEPKVLPRNAFDSSKVAAAHLGGIIADLLTAFAAQQADQTYLMINVRDGFMPTAIP